MIPGSFALDVVVVVFVWMLVMLVGGAALVSSDFGVGAFMVGCFMAVCFSSRACVAACHVVDLCWSCSFIFVADDLSRL